MDILNCLNCNNEILKGRKFCSRKCRHDFIEEKNKKRCEFCGNIFVSVNKYRKYCSSRCSNKSNSKKHRIEICCKFCKNNFTRTKSQVKVSDPKFCSMECYKKYNKENKIGFYKKKKKQLFNKNCEHCGKIFKIHNYRKKTARFCSQLCFDQSRRIIKICPTCKNQFIYPKYEKRKYCSLTCAYKGVQRTNYFSKELFSEIKKDFNNLKVIEEYKIKLELNIYFIDIYIEDFSLCIEADGQYWHCDKRVYPPAFFHKQIRKTAQEIWDRDNNKDNNLLKNNYKILRVKEYDWIKNKHETYLNIKEKINEICKNRINKNC